MSPAKNSRYAWLASAGRFTAWLAGLALLLLALLPWRPLLYDAALDPSRQMVLHWAYAKGIVFGRDLVFTYGPLGFLNWRYYHPETFALLMTLRGLLAIHRRNVGEPAE